MMLENENPHKISSIMSILWSKCIELEKIKPLGLGMSFKGEPSPAVPELKLLGSCRRRSFIGYWCSMLSNV